MRDQTVARNYAETLFALGRKHGAMDEFGAALGTVARLLDEDPRFRIFLETPRIEDAEQIGRAHV